MKKLLLSSIASLLFCAVAPGATDVSGKWSGGSGGPIYVIFKQEGSKLSGSAGPSESQQFLSFENGTVEGDHLAFKVGPMQFDLRIDGDEIKGELKREDVAIEVLLTRVEVLQRRAQSQAGVSAPPVFEVASVKPNKSGGGSISGRGGSIRLSKGQITMENVTLWKCMGYAYGVGEDKDYAISGPEWLKSERYDIAAKFPAGSPQIQQMLQTLLAQRFKLTLHRETKELPVYGLVVAKNGLKLHEVELGQGGVNGRPGRLIGKGVPMWKLADHLSQVLDRPVLDMTGIKGVFDFTLEWTPDDGPAVPRPGDTDPERTANDSSSGPSIFAAVQQQLGLRLEARKGPVEVIVVDHAEKVPIEN